MIADDAISLAKQTGQAADNPSHEYRTTSAPTSKARILVNLNKNNKHSSLKFKFANALPWLETQKGQTCKLHAFHSSLWVTHLLTPKATACPLPIHSHGEYDEYKPTLLEQAKKLFKSCVGEVHSPLYLLQLAKTNDYNNVKMLQCNSSNYLDELKNIIDAGNLALVYFDVGLNPDPKLAHRYGFPANEKGVFEHSAAICAYMTTEEGQLAFLAYQWENYYIFSAQELLESTGQLSLQRTPEVFYNFGTQKNPSWWESGRINRFYPDKLNNIKNDTEMVMSLPVPKGLPNYRYCIISVGPNISNTLGMKQS